MATLVHPSRPACSLIALLFLLLAGCDSAPAPPAYDYPSDLPAPIRTPAGELGTFRLAPGLRIELVAAEPMVQDPVAMTFDEAGRLWVVEMRGFMPNVDGRGEDEPVGRVSVLEDRDGDGVMDRSTVFMDGLVMPRAVALVDGGVLVAEAQPLWFVEDRDGDLRPDAKTLVDPDYGAGGLPEHAPNGLWRGVDGWLYNAKSHFRYRQTPAGWEKDSTAFRGQWGLSHDDAGRLFYNYNWSQLHADLLPADELQRNPNHVPTSGIDHGLTTDMRVFPAHPTPAVNRGYTPEALDEQGRLRAFTSASAPLVYRGTALPAEFYGNAFVCEPAGNLIKRNIVETDGLLLTARFAYPDFEFVASTDERFRPVFLAAGPDGALYIADMYRGIIQHGAYMTPYLREQTIERGLDRGIHYGRIWRVVPEGWTPPARRLPAEASTAELAGLLSDPDGWIRDTAQRLLVQRRDTAALPLLHDVVRRGGSAPGRLHALWTLDGLGDANAPLLFTALDDSSDFVRGAAMRLLAARARDDAEVRRALAPALARQRPHASPYLAAHIALAAGALDEADALPLLAGIVDTYASRPVLRDAVMSSLAGRELAMLDRLWTHPSWQAPDAGRSILLEILAAAIARKGDARAIASVQARIDALAPDDARCAALRAGLDAHRPALAASTDASSMSDEDRERFALGRQRYLSACAGCHGLDGAGLPRFGPPLAGSEWVTGDERRLIRILLHGMEGPVEVAGKRYGPPDILPVMPPQSMLDDAEIAAILTYIRNAWGNAAEPVAPGTVGRIRHGTQGTPPWTPEALRDLPSSHPPSTI